VLKVGKNPVRVRSGAVIYDEPEAARFLTAVRKIKEQLLRKVRQTRLAKQKARRVLRKLRAV
jgi:hypothetical protein